MAVACRQSALTAVLTGPRAIAYHSGMDESAVLAALSTLTDADGAPLVAADEVTGVLVEGDWVCVLLRKEEASGTDFLARVHGHLARAFPGVEVELRTAGRIYRGGAGFGEGRHVVAVLGGKGGVGKSTVSVNLALTLWAMGIPVGLLDGDLNAPDIPHMLGVHPQERPREPGAGRRGQRGMGGEGWHRLCFSESRTDQRRSWGRQTWALSPGSFWG